MRKCVTAIALGSWIAVGVACGVGDSPAASDTSRLSQAVVLTSLQTAPAQGRFLVTPRWSAQGDRLLLSGFRGVGLHTLDLQTGAFRDLDWTDRARARWDESGQIAPEVRRMDGPNEVLFDQGGVRVLHRIRDGAIEAVSPGRSTQLAAGGAWGARVSADGKLVAYCTGHLMTGRLRVLDIGGTELYEGPGVHSAWSPGRPELFFAVPEKSVSPQGILELGASDLYVVAAPDWTPIRLTSTPDAWEMEPAVSPAGDRLAFSDWKTGTLTIAHVGRAGGAP